VWEVGKEKERKKCENSSVAQASGLYNGEMKKKGEGLREKER